MDGHEIGLKPVQHFLLLIISVPARRAIIRATIGKSSFVLVGVGVIVSIESGNNLAVTGMVMSGVERTLIPFLITHQG